MRTSPTNDALRAFSRSGRGALQSRGGALPRLQHPWPVVASSSIHDREAASVSPGAASRSHQDPRTMQMSGRNDLVGRVRRRVDAALLARAGGVSAALGAREQGVAVGVADRQSLRRPESHLRVPTDGGVGVVSSCARA